MIMTVKMHCALCFILGALQVITQSFLITPAVSTDMIPILKDKIEIQQS